MLLSTDLRLQGFALCSADDVLTLWLCSVYYRNPLSSVKKLLDEKHVGHYMLFNLCSERQYRASKFGADVACFPFEDHQVNQLCEYLHREMSSAGYVAVLC